ncbi:MAG: hypothetical protein WC314_26225 [Vulcanimicrobiota bacterium]
MKINPLQPWKATGSSRPAPAAPRQECRLPDLRDQAHLSVPAPIRESAPESFSPASRATLPESPSRPSVTGPIFEEDSYPRSYFHPFDAPADLVHAPADIQATWNSRMPAPAWDFMENLTAGSPVRVGGGDISLEGRNGEAQILEYNLDLVQGSKQIGSMSREFIFEDDGARVHHQYFEIDAALQGQGVAKQILANSVELYDRMGVQSVSLFAGLQVGGYAWAKYGFKPEAGPETADLFDTVRGRLQDLDVPPATKRSVQRLLAENKPEAVWALSDLDGVKVDNGKVPLGKALLMGTSWAGKLDLTCPDSRARFEQYIHKGCTGSAQKGQ